MMDAAEALFLERGFEATSLGAIVQRSGGSLSTLYEAFGNKQQLLRAVADRNREQYMGDLRDLDIDKIPAREILMIVAQRIHSFALLPRSIAMLRIVISQAKVDPEFGAEFHKQSRLLVQSKITELLHYLDEQGRAKIDNPIQAADLFLAMIMCDAHLITLMGLPAEETDMALIEQRLAPFFAYFAL